MRKASIMLVSSLLVFRAFAQQPTGKTITDSIKDKQISDSANNVSLYKYRKYSFSLAIAPYTSVTRGGGNSLFGATEVSFSDRFKWLNSTKNASLEVNMGFSFVPYQGTKLNLGFDWLMIRNKSHRTNLYGGLQFAEGLKQSTNTQDTTYVTLGYHSYLTPFVGFIWWPWKAKYQSDKYERDFKALAPEQAHANENFYNPHIPQLFYIKLQIGYSILLNDRVTVDTTGGFSDVNLYRTIRNNTASCLVFRFCIGINIPSLHDREDQERLKFTRSLRAN
ncbi:MAG TPA: hypothetical protein VGS79_03005 [Puia sp.]|nr:hypothetical protein [Puia sp.]